MAYSDNAQIISLTAGSTFAASDLYKFVDLDSDGNAIISVSTNNSMPMGVLYGVTKTTSTDSEKVPVAIGGVVKVRMTASTAAAGNFVAASSIGLGIIPTTNRFIVGRIVEGTSGAVNRIVTMLWRPGPNSATP